MCTIEKYGLGLSLIYNVFFKFVTLYSLPYNIIVPTIDNNNFVYLRKHFS